jgi:chromosome segregation ATPase
MDLPPETEEYIRETIESSLGLQISAKNMQLRLITSEDERHRLQDQVFHLEDCLRKATRQIELYKVFFCFDSV